MENTHKIKTAKGTIPKKQEQWKKDTPTTLTETINRFEALDELDLKYKPQHKTK